MTIDPVHARAGEPPQPVLVWRLPVPMVAIASAPHGGGIGLRRWVLNAQVGADYTRTDIDAHVAELADGLECAGPGVGFLTAAALEDVARVVDDHVSVFATVGLQHPTWAAAPHAADETATVETINIVAFAPVRLSDAALVNAATTVTEAKTQALIEAGVPGTGTASDALCVLVPDGEPSERFGGPRSVVGAALARATHRAVTDGIARQ
jgi:adenosylcobinamide amidohydrolase